MRLTVRSLLTAALMLSLSACKNDHKSERRFTILFTTDEHSHLFALPPEKDDFPMATTPGTGSLKGGVARRFAILTAERERAASNGADAITVSAGDFSQGTLANAAFLQTSPDLVLLRKMHYDAVAIGNHEFDLGPTGLAGAIQIAQARLGAAGDDLPHLLIANMILDGQTGTADDGLEALRAAGAIAPSRLVTLPGGLKIGIVAWMGAAAGTDAAGAAPVRFWTTTSSTTAAKLADIAAQIQTVVDDLRNTQHVDAVVALGHGGIGPLRTGAPGDDEAIASMVRGLDVVISGHSHERPETPHLVLDPDGHYVPVLQAAPYGEEVGRVQLVSRDGGRPVLEPGETAFIPVDDRTVPTPNAAILAELATTIATVESGFAPATLAVAGIPFTPGTPGDGSLYYKDICHTSFYTRGLGAGESNVTNLDTDAMLATANGLGLPTTIALQNYGSIRTDLVVGKTGGLSFSDLFRAVPNGVDPGNGTPGFPLVRVGIPNVALRIALEGSLLQSMLDGDYFLSGSGIRVEYDTSRPMFDPVAAATNPFTPGWITRIVLTGPDPDVEFYNASLDGLPSPFGPTHFFVDPTEIQPVATSYFVASFASAFGVPLYDLATRAQLNPPGGASLLYDAVIRWPADRPGVTALGTAVKDHQSLLNYVYETCAANGGALPSMYDDAAPEGHVPRRMVDCTGGVCL